MSAATPRPRAVSACLVCRRRKIKCDRIHPSCGRCQQQGIICEWAPSGNQIRFVGSPATPSPPAQAAPAAQPPPRHIEPEARALGPQRTTGIFGGDRYIGGVFWDLAKDLDSNDVRNILQAAADAAASMEIIQLEHILPSLPPDCSAFLDAFVTSVHPIFPLVDVAAVTRAYHALWSQPTIELSTLLLVLAAIHAGAVAAFSPACNSLQSLFNSLFPQSSLNTSPTLPLLQAYTLLHTSVITESQPLSSYTFLPTAIRAAQQLGLHHTDSPSGQRQWYHLLHLDIEASIASGLPRIIHTEDFTTQPPALPDLSPALAAAVTARWDWSKQMHSWMRHLPSSTEISAFEARYSELVLDDPWAADYIRLLGPRARCVLSHPRVCDAAVHEAAREFLRVYSRMMRSGRFLWYLTGILIPVHPPIILLLELLRLSPEALRSDTPDRDLLATGFELVSPYKIAKMPRRDGGEAKMVCGLLGKLKMRVWEKAGWADVAAHSVHEQVEAEFDWQEWDEMVARFFTTY